MRSLGDERSVQMPMGTVWRFYTRSQTNRRARVTMVRSTTSLTTKRRGRGGLASSKILCHVSSRGRTNPSTRSWWMRRRVRISSPTPTMATKKTQRHLGIHKRRGRTNIGSWASMLRPIQTSMVACAFRHSVSPVMRRSTARRSRCRSTRSSRAMPRPEIHGVRYTVTT